MAQKITTTGKTIILDRVFNASPTRTAPSQFKIGTGTTDPSISDTDLETPVSIDGHNLKDFVSGYPTINTTSNQSTTRCFLNTLEANGNALTEFGTFNSDASELIFSRSTFTPLNKTSSIEVTIIEKNRVV